MFVPSISQVPALISTWQHHHGGFTPSIIDELILLDLNLQGLPCHLPRLQSMTQELSRMWSLPAFPASFLIVLHFEFYAVATSSSSCVPHLQWQLALLAFLLQFLYPSPYFYLANSCSSSKTQFSLSSALHSKVLSICYYWLIDSASVEKKPQKVSSFYISMSVGPKLACIYIP